MAGMHGAGGEPAAGPDAGDSGEVLEKLEALLGRLRGPDSPGEYPLVRPEIPTLNEPVHLAVRAAGLHAIPTGGDIPTLTEPVELHDAKPPASPAMAPSQPVVTVPQATVAPPARHPMTPQELRERLEAMLPHDLEHRLHERAMASLERTLIDIERGFRDELAAWREEQTAQIRDQVRAEVERAVDEVLAEVTRQRGPGAP
jgi:hypothetical protein